jgi:hypothetical protein
MARQTKPAQSVYDFDVHQEPLLTTDGKRTGYFGMVRRDTAEPITLGVCTEQYGVVKNADLIEMVETNLANHDKLSNFTSKKFVVRDGARFYASYDFTDFKTELKPVGKRAKGDILGLRLVVNNSYDRSTRVSLSLGFLRLICENGMTSLTKEFSMTKRHTLAVNLDFVGDALAHACDSVESSAQVFNKLAQKALTNEQGLNLLTKLEEKDIISGKVREGIEAVWRNPAYEEDTDRNLYNLYNAATQFLTRNVSQERYEYSERVNRDLLKVFSGKTRDEDLLKLVA